MTRSILPSFALALALALAACANADDATDEPPVPDGDIVSPSVVSTFPADGAVGVGPDTVITITFSEPMNDASVDAELELTGFDDVLLTWNAENTELTVTPAAPLEVVETPLDGDMPAAAYSVMVPGTVTDLAGNPTGSDTVVSFTVVRQLWGRLGAVAELTRVVTPSDLLFEDHGPLVVGDTASDGGMRSTMTFDLSVLPVTALTDARITTTQLEDEHTGSPFDGLGTLMLDHVSFEALETEADINAAFNSSQHATRTYSGIASATSHVDIDIDVLDAVNEDLAGDGESSQFLLYFDGFTDIDGVQDRAAFSRTDLRLEFVARIP